LAACQQQQPTTACLGGTGSPPSHLLIGPDGAPDWDVAAATANATGSADFGAAVSDINMLVTSQGKWNCLVLFNGVQKRTYLYLNGEQG